ncbi:MAG: SpaH/EbpB family LPXTG-anchored major pilin [Arachnia propionica]|uniref:SpaH/EbpB family LPXTG-anchored major pilin n=1 Tax=Arachnia propionica TaxID=1750 RepID=UPI002703298C|nr:SpaH/EbpB family LPXTG-anchored major pilin [Arachnia propionica]
MTERRNPGWRLLALTAAFALALIGWAAPSHADEPPGPANIQVPPGGMTLNIHKCVQPPQQGAPASGAEQQTGCTPIQGVTFELYKVSSVNLGSAEGWAKVPGIQAPESGSTIDGHTTELKSTLVTNGTGLARFQGLEIGLYLVVESDTGAPNTGVVLGSRPFLVTLPYATDNEWNYDVHVYPKNSLAGIEKTVTDDLNTAGYVGRNVTWTVTSDVPRQGQNVQIDSYVITDTLPAGLTHVSTAMALDNGVNFEQGVDVTCTTTVTCTFTSVGLAKLNQNPGSKVVTTIVTHVTDVTSATAEGVFTNTAKVTINGNDSAEVTAQTTWGQLRIHKFDQATRKALGGAVFKLCPDAQCVNVAVADLATDQDGFVTVPVLRPGQYFLVETTAPNGYVLDASPKEITIAGGALTVAGDPTTEAGTKNYKAVPNTKQDLPALPMTGGIGQVALIAGGIGMFVLALGIVVLGRLNSRRRR